MGSYIKDYVFNTEFHSVQRRKIIGSKKSAKCKNYREGNVRENTHESFWNSPMADLDYVQPGELEILKRKSPKKQGVRKRAKRTTVLSQAWPKIKQLALKGIQPKDIRDMVNATLPENQRITNQQVSNLIGRKRREGEIPQLTVTKHGGGLKAKKSDSM